MLNCIFDQTDYYIITRATQATVDSEALTLKS